MKRTAENSLNEWYSRKSRKPLVLRGARQVGKSTLVRLFAQSRKLKLVEVNLEVDKFRTLKNEELDVEAFIAEVEAKKDLTLGKDSLLFLDEIQKSPPAFMMLRYFFEKRKDLAVIAAGSLLEFLFETEKISVPVGRVEYLHLGPMNFEEFLMATNSHGLLSDLRKNNFLIKPEHADLLKKKFDQFLFVGGMPEAVSTFVTEKSLSRVRLIQNTILQTYEDDFPKYTKQGEFRRLTHVFSCLHNFVGKKIKYSEISREYQSKETRACVELLEKARVIIRCFHSSLDQLTLSGSHDPFTYKIYYLDVGLLCAKLKIPIENALGLSEIDSSMKGIIYEQFVAQHLAYASLLESPQLYYWLRDKKSDLAEVDFVIQYHQKIIPIEVKSGKNGKLKSLHQILGLKKLPLAVKLSPEDVENEKDPLQKVLAKYIKNNKIESIRFQLLSLHSCQAQWLEQILTALLHRV